MRLLYKSSLSKIYPNIGVYFETLDKVMVEIGIHDANKIIFENNDIRQHE